MDPRGRWNIAARLLCRCFFRLRCRLLVPAQARPAIQSHLFSNLSGDVNLVALGLCESVVNLFAAQFNAVIVCGLSHLNESNVRLCAVRSETFDLT